MEHADITVVAALYLNKALRKKLCPSAATIGNTAVRRMEVLELAHWGWMDYSAVIIPMTSEPSWPAIKGIHYYFSIHSAYK